MCVHLLFTLNQNYLTPFKTLLNSIFMHQSEKLVVHLLHHSISSEELMILQEFVEANGHQFIPQKITQLFTELEKKTAVNRYYSEEMYYRLLAPFLLGDEVERILYLDPDMINLQDFSNFYKQDFEENYFVATSHDYATKWIQPFNNLRLQTLHSESYFNTGLLLMNLPLIRNHMTYEKVIKAIKSFKTPLILPDQDIFNHLYWAHVKEADWRVYNLDPRIYTGLATLLPKSAYVKWLEENVVFIHYCGKHKPWLEKESYKYDLGEYFWRYYEK